MTERDLELRNLTYGLIPRLGRVPLAEEAADAAGLSRDELLKSWRRLHEAHALVLDGDEIRMANPFSAVETPYRVEAGGRSWYANCAWDAFGVCSILGGNGRIEHRDLAVEVRANRPDDESLLFHCLVPAAHWWDDIVYT